MRNLKTLLTALALVFAAAALGACDNTIRGVGQDVHDTGNAIEDATR